MKIFNIINPELSEFPREIFFYEFIKNNDLKQNLAKYKLLSDLNNKNGRTILKELFALFGIDVDNNTLKQLGTISFEVRKIIKDTNKGLLEIIDAPNFILPYTYLLSGFHFDIKTNNGKNNVNSHYALASFIIQSLKNEKNNISSFLCAHRENKNVQKHVLTENVNLKEFARVINLIKGYFENIGKPYDVTFFHLDGDEKGLNSVFPALFIKYFERGELYKMSLLLDKHYSQISEYTNNVSNVTINKVSKHFDNVVSNLDKKYGEKWRKISIKELSILAEQNKFEEIAYYMTLPDLQRFKLALEDLKKYDIVQLTKLNVEKAKKVGKEEVVSKAIDMFINSMSLGGKSLYETMFYYLWGKNSKNNNGLALGFDRDHDLFQVEAFSIGYKPKIIKSMIPLLYARRTGKKSGNKLNELSFRQFWHYYD